MKLGPLPVIIIASVVFIVYWFTLGEGSGNYTPSKEHKPGPVIGQFKL